MAGKKESRARIMSRMNNRIKRKLALIFSLVVLALIVVCIRLAYINKTNGDKYTLKVLAQQDTDSVTLPYKRGDILDRNGTILATSEKVYNLILDAKVLSQYADEDEESDCVEPTLQALAEVYDDLEYSELVSIYNEKISSSYIVLLEDLSKEEMEAFEAVEEESSRIKGVWFEDSYVRTYPYDSLACKVIGYTVSGGDQGQTGIEEEYNDTLNGTNGRSYKYLTEDLETETVIREAEDGYSVVSTIDATLQGIVEKYIDQFIEDYTDLYVEGDAAKNIGVIMMDPQTGEILAMAGDVDFDLNNPYDLVGNGYATQEEVDAMTEDEQLDALNQMWRNFCISDGYEPGSTVKPMVVAAALEMGVVSDSSTFLCDGGQVVVTGEDMIRCSKRSGHGIITLEGAIMFSCNDALMQIAALMGGTTFLQYQQIFNFGLKTNIDLPGEANNATTVFTEETLGVTELATSSFGQGYNTTMIQVAAAFCSVINGGYYYQPHVVKQIIDSDNSVVETISPTVVRRTISSETSALMRQYLYNTMYGEEDENGNTATGRKARVAGYSMGGKTGTAQKVPRSAGTYLVSFIGFAPADDPQVLCYVVIDEPNAADSSSQASSAYAQELFKNIMTEAMPYLNIYATEEIPEDMLDEVEAEEEEEEETEEEEEEEELEEGTLVDPNTGEVVTMPTEEDLEDDGEGDIMNSVVSPILEGDTAGDDTDGEDDADGGDDADSEGDTADDSGGGDDDG